MAGKKNGARGEEGKMTKKEAVRRALAKLGKQALPTQIKTFVKEAFNIEMNTDHISTVKGDLRRKAKQARAARKSAPEKDQPEAAPRSKAQPASGPGNGNAAVMLDDVLTLRELVERVGPAPLRTLLDAMTR